MSDLLIWIIIIFLVIALIVLLSLPIRLGVRDFNKVTIGSYIRILSPYSNHYHYMDRKVIDKRNILIKGKPEEVLLVFANGENEKDGIIKIQKIHFIVGDVFRID